jgi:DNA-binding beta-propeller fold protein YncE
MMAHRMGRTEGTLRRSGTVAAIVAALVTFAALAAASASAAPLVWLPNKLEESISTYDSATGAEVGSPIALSGTPFATVITPNGRRAIVLEPVDSRVRVIETASRRPLRPIAIEGTPQYVAVSPDGRTAYVTTTTGSEVEVIDVETASLVGSIPVAANLREVAFSPDGSFAYVGTGDEDIAVLDTEREEVVGAPLVIGGDVTSIAFAADGETAYVAAAGVYGVRVIDTALGQVVRTIPLPEPAIGVAVSPDGKHLYIANENPGTLRVADTATNTVVGRPISVPTEVLEFAIAPDGQTAWVVGAGELTAVDLPTGKARPAIADAGGEKLAIAPDRSPTASFMPPTVFAGTPAAFSGAASTDPDGSVAGWSWAFGDGGIATGVSPTHTYAAPRTYIAKLTVTDDEGCGEEEVFTGRTAYCSGNDAASVIHAVTAKAPPVVAPVVVPSNKFRVGRILHNRHNGTVRMQVKLPSAGFVLLFGPKVHAVTRKSKGVQTMWLTIHARVELNKRLKKILRAPVRIRLTFTPNGGTARTVHRSVVLQRAPRHRHGKRHRHR